MKDSTCLSIMSIALILLIAFMWYCVASSNSEETEIQKIQDSTYRYEIKCLHLGGKLYVTPNHIEYCRLPNGKVLEN